MESFYFNLLHPFAIAFLIIMGIDGIKVLIESLCSGSKLIVYRSDHNKVTVIVAAHNEEQLILKTIASLLMIVPVKNVIIADDGSTDRTAELVKKHYPDVTLLSDVNKGKVGAIHRVLTFVKTPYVLLMDADTQLKSNFMIPTEALDNGSATAVCFNIAPVVVGKGFFNKMWLYFQSHEYIKSAQIGKRFNNPTKSIHCISGAIGLFKTDRLIELSKKHSTIFPGEDLERTLHELASDGLVIFSDSTVYTDVPETFRQLTRQRIIGWWPGLWRNLWLFGKIVIRRKKPIRLRYELIYEIFALVTNPLKIISLVGLIIIGQWPLLLFIFAIYMLLEIFVFFKIRSLIGKYMGMEAIIIGLFPFYALYQMFCVSLAFFIFVYKKFFTNDWAKVMSLLIFFSASAMAQTEKKKDWTIDVSHSHIVDLNKDRTFENVETYIGYKNLYADVTSGPYNAISAGAYLGSFTVDTRYQWQSKGGSLNLRYEHWFNNFVPFVNVGYGVFAKEATITNSSFFKTGLGLSYYLGDKSNISIEAQKEFGRLYGITYVSKAKLVKNDFWTNFGASINSFGYPGAFGQIGYKFIYLHGDYYEHFDYNNFTRTSIGAGLKFSF